MSDETLGGDIVSDLKNKIWRLEIEIEQSLTAIKELLDKENALKIQLSQKAVEAAELRVENKKLKAEVDTWKRRDCCSRCYENYD